MNPKEMKIRIPPNLKDRLADRAKRNDRTLNGEVLQILKSALGGDEAQSKAA